MRRPSGSTVALEIPAGSGNAQVAASIEGKWRFITATINASAPANAEGEYPIYLTSRANNEGQEDSGTFDYTFGLKLATAPTGTGSEAISRQVGTYYWSGTAITDIRLSVPQPFRFLRGEAADRPAAATTNQGWVYWAYDTGELSRSTGSAWELAVPTISTFIKGLLDDADASTALTTLGFSAFFKTLIDEADASALLAALGVSAFIQTLLNDSDAATARGTLGISSDIPTGAMMDYALPSAPAGWQVCDGSVAGSAALLTALDNAGRPYGGSAGAGLVPDTRGRVRVPLGTHTEVDALGENDGLAVGSRKVKHRHGKGTLNITSSGSHNHGPGNGGSFVTNEDPNGQLNLSFSSGNDHDLVGSTSSSSHTHPNGNFAGEVGDTTGPLDGPAFLVINNIIKL